MSKNDKKKLSINLEFSERIQYEDRIVDTHHFAIYKSFSIEKKDFEKKHDQIKEDFRILEKKYD
ncbi:hypothetical protein LCGC14_1811170 [marine sediment metagenome]|uniref:Uncharacterized protein n=1 Tax=marine sediment metagenome TaxID=412755 RepID=A0A0F9J1I3_9ZZZZ